MYNDDFYMDYCYVYLTESKVRSVHNSMFDFFDSLKKKPRIIDLGCGVREYYSHGKFKYGSYTGIEQQVNKYTKHPLVYHGDYNKDVKWSLYDAFISLFSTECCLSVKDKYTFYEKIFKENDNIDIGMVSGFYYLGKEKEEQVTENGNLVSYQTIESQQEHISPYYTEFRSYVPVPSKFFGDNVIEVWKFFIRKS